MQFTVAEPRVRSDPTHVGDSLQTTGAETSAKHQDCASDHMDASLAGHSGSPEWRPEWTVPKRLFVALMPPPIALDELSAALQPLRAAAPTARWTRPESWHLTLAFLGAVEEPTAGLLVERFGQVAERQSPIKLRIAGAGHFDNRVLWAGIAGEREPLQRLAESVRAAARQTGVEIETRPYRGHITLARGSGMHLRPLADQLRACAGSAWTATELLLMESRLGAGPARTARHEIYARWPLRQQCETVA